MLLQEFMLQCMSSMVSIPSEATAVLQVYDVILDAALQAQKCGSDKLQVEGEWEWLLTEFAG